MITEYSKYVRLWTTRKRGSIPVRSGGSSLLQSVPSGSGTHPISYPVCTSISFPGSIVTEAKCWPLTSTYCWRYWECVQMYTYQLDGVTADYLLFLRRYLSPKTWRIYLKTIKRSFVRPRRRCEMYIKICNKEMSYEGLVWADLCQDGDKWRDMERSSNLGFHKIRDTYWLNERRRNDTWIVTYLSTYFAYRCLTDCLADCLTDRLIEWLTDRRSASLKRQVYRKRAKKTSKNIIKYIHMFQYKSISIMCLSLSDKFILLHCEIHLFLWS